MFSANENLMLRQHKRKIVENIEATMPEEALDMGTNVMVMQVSCKAPGCVPLETAIVIVFPKSPTELVPGLPESKNGGNYKTKILKPMSEVTKEDILDALPPAFRGGRRTMERLCLHARDVMLAQITQLLGDDEDDQSIDDRQAMAEYLQGCLQSYIANKCQAPELLEPFPNFPTDTSGKQEEAQGEDKLANDQNEEISADSSIPLAVPNSTTMSFPSRGNLVIRREVPNSTTSQTCISVAENQPQGAGMGFSGSRRT